MGHPERSNNSHKTSVTRAFGWLVLGVMTAYLVNNFMTFWAGWPGAFSALNGPLDGFALFQAGLFAFAVAAAFAHVLRTPTTSLTSDAARVSALNAWFIRCAFWSVFLIGIVDAGISYLRVEDLLEPIVGETLDSQLGRARFRGPWVHLPLMIAGLFLGSTTKTLGFHWLAVLIVIAELLIVILRFIFSYEQAFMSDLVRFWYGALFLFASAHTLLEDGHVRVDILYSAMSTRAKGRIDSIGAILFGLVLCWTILLVGMGQKTSIINSPILNFETTQSGFGMYVKYLMAAFLGVFAVSMMIQFVSSLFQSIANTQEESLPGPSAEKT